MPNKMPIAAVAAGVTGSPYLAVLSYLAKGTGNYPFTEANFAGLSRYLPGTVVVASGTLANVFVEISTDGGTTWKAAGAAGGGMYYIDASGLNMRLRIATGATDIFLFPLGG